MCRPPKIMRMLTDILLPLKDLFAKFMSCRNENGQMHRDYAHQAHSLKALKFSFFELHFLIKHQRLSFIFLITDIF